MRAVLLTILIFGLILPAYSAGQSVDPQKIKESGQNKLEANSNDPSLSSPYSGANVQLLLETTRLDEKRAKAQIGFRQGDSIYSLILEGPLGAKGEQATWADFNGLANSVVADIGFCNFVWKVSPDVSQKYEDAVIAYKKDFLKTKTSAEWEKFVAEKDGANIDFDNLPEKYKQQLKGIFGTPLQWGVRFRVGREKHSYLDPVTYSETEEIKTNFAAVWFNGIVFPDSNLYLGLSYRYQSAFKAGDAQKTCVPIQGSPGALRCYEMPIGAPLKKVSSIFQFEARYFLSPRFALNPKIAYDISLKAVGIEIPFYFLTEEKKGLNGGVSLGWRSDKKDLGLILFIGNAFKIFHD